MHQPKKSNINYSFKTAKYCPEPPTIEQGGTVFANSTGNKYGAVCLGNDSEEPVPTACPLVTVQHDRGQILTNPLFLGFNVSYFQHLIYSITKPCFHI